MKELFEQNYPEHKFIIEFFSLLDLFNQMRKACLSKILEENWKQNILSFLSALDGFMSKSKSIGLTNLHHLVHVPDICDKYQIGLACLGADSQIEAYHGYVVKKIKPHIGNAPVIPDNSVVYSKENPPPKNVANYHRDIFARCLESSLKKIKIKNEETSHKDHSENLTINVSFVKNLIENLDSKPNPKLFEKLTDKLSKNLSIFSSVSSQPTVNVQK